MIVEKLGLFSGDISIRITPLTYDQFEARGYDLDNFFPNRPPAASSKRLYNLIIKVVNLLIYNEVHVYKYPCVWDIRMWLVGTIDLLYVTIST